MASKDSFILIHDVYGDSVKLFCYSQTQLVTSQRYDNTSVKHVQIIGMRTWYKYGFHWVKRFVVITLKKVQGK